MRLSSPIYFLKRQAKLLARNNKIKLHEALNQMAVAEGFESWSHLAAKISKTAPAQAILEKVVAGDLVVIGARPGHGKTLLGLELLISAAKSDRMGFFFTLDYNETEVWDRIEELGMMPQEFKTPIYIDTSDSICASYIIKRLKNVPEGAIVVVDYLQLLDQKRSNPPLAEQVREIKTFAFERGLTVFLISQIDRAFDRSAKPLPGIEDIRLPNPIERSIFDKGCFLHDGEIQIETTAPR